MSEVGLMIDCRHCDLPAEFGPIFVGPWGIMRTINCVGDHHYTEMVEIEEIPDIQRNT